MVRGHAVALTLLVAAPVLAGCSSDPQVVSDRDDLDAAVAVWADPWVAPVSASVAGPALGSNGQVARVVARRSTPYATDVEAATRVELRIASDAGWRPTSSTCGDSVQVALVGPADAVAQLVVTPDGPDSDAALQVVVPHHLDGTWQAPDPIDRTCLDGAATGFEPPPVQSAPLGDRDADDDADDKAAEWPGGSPDPSTVDAAAADPALAGLGIRVAAPRVEPGVNRRRAPAAAVTVAVGSLARLARRLAGWDLTYAACGADGPVRATFLGDLGGAPAVVSAAIDDGEAEVRLVLPMTDGPAPGWLDGLTPLDPTAVCADPGGSSVVVTGTPAVLPDALTPLAD